MYVNVPFIKLYTILKTVKIQTSWLLMKPADQDPHCLFQPHDIFILLFRKRKWLLLKIIKKNVLCVPLMHILTYNIY